jgi:hypothetical protein
MEVDYAVLADHGTARGDGKLDIIGAGFDTIFAPQAPARHPRFVLAVRFVMLAEEARNDHEIAAVLRTSDGEELSRAGGPFPPLPEEYIAEAPVGEDVGVAVVLVFENVVFPSFGMYVLSLEWDGTPVLSRRLRLAEPPAAPR